MKMLVVCPHPEGVAPGQRLKYEQYFGYFREKGIEVTVKPFQTMRFWDIVFKKGHLLEKIFWTLFGYWQRFLLLFTLGKYDVVYVFLWVTPFGKPLFESLYRKASKKMIYDIDDLVFMGKASKNNSWIAALKGKQKPIYMMKHAEHIITCTPYLDGFVRKYNPHTTDISSTVITENYPSSKQYAHIGKIIIGWSGSHSTSGYLYLLQPVLKKLAEKYQFELLVMGDPKVKMEGISVTAIPWTEQDEITTISKFDIGVYPLPDEEWVYGKSGLKAIQYMAAGVPTVATAIGANFRVIEDNVSGFLVKTEEEWFQAFEALINDPVLREKIGTNAKERVEKLFSVNANRDVYLRIIQSV